MLSGTDSSQARLYDLRDRCLVSPYIAVSDMNVKPGHYAECFQLAQCNKPEIILSFTCSSGCRRDRSFPMTSRSGRVQIPLGTPKQSGSNPFGNTKTITTLSVR